MKVSIIIFAVCVIYTFGCNKKSMDESSLELEHYGVYVIQKESSELKGFQHEGMYDHFLGSNVNSIPTITNKEGKIKIVTFLNQDKGDYVLLTKLNRAPNGEIMTCFNCGSDNPKTALQIDLFETPSENPKYRIFTAKELNGVYCFLNKTNRMGYFLK
ncbi:MAG: hypothetical protein IPN57_04170 [Ignavibacteria bacterium]|nr:hypothetical protein [Ignavibacteria bacterium]